MHITSHRPIRPLAARKQPQSALAAKPAVVRAQAAAAQTKTEPPKSGDVPWAPKSLASGAGTVVLGAAGLVAGGMLGAPMFAWGGTMLIGGLAAIGLGAAAGAFLGGWLGHGIKRLITE